MSKRWTQDDEDPARLPEGVKRVGYDADTSRYTFLDRKGTMYRSEPGAEYGKLSPVQDPIQRFEQERPQAFNNPEQADEDDAPRFAPTSFEQFVPRHLITSPKSGPDDPDPESKSKLRRKLTLKPSSSKSGSGFSTSSSKRASSSSHASKEYPSSAPPSTLRFKDAARRSGFGMPKIAGVVEGLRRSMTGSRKPTGGGHGRSKSETVDGEYTQLVDFEKK